MLRKALFGVVALAMAEGVLARTPPSKPASPPGTAATQVGGKLAMMWGTTLAVAPFTVGS